MSGILTSQHGISLSNSVDDKTIAVSSGTLKIKNADSSIVGGEIIYIDSSGNTQQLNPSTSGYKLQTNGNGNAPSWVASSYTLLGSSTPLVGSAATLSANITTTGYSKLIIYCFAKNTTGASGIEIRFNGDSTSGHYKYNGLFVNSTTVTGAGSASSTQILCGEVSNSSLTMTVLEVSNISGQSKTVLTRSHGAGTIFSTYGGIFNDASTNLEISSVTFTMDSNQYAIGSYFEVYGVV